MQRVSLSLLLYLESHGARSLLARPLLETTSQFTKHIAKMGCSTSKVEISPSTKKTDKMEDYVEGVVCKASEIADNEMKTFDLCDAGKVLLVKQHGKISALGTKCTHYGAPLVNGALGDGRVRCQWHGACFNILTGDIEDFPGFDSLPCHQVTIENDEVRVRAKRSQLESNKRVKAMARCDAREQQHIVVIGGGPSGAICVETLRQEGYTGQITLVCKENYLPYDRVKVSKAMDFEIEKNQFRSPEFYKEHNITILLDTEATAVDTSAQCVSLSSGNSLNYDKLYLATGMTAIKANIPGADLKNVVVLRDYAHSEEANCFLSPEKEVVVLGSSFVALEAANYCLNKVKKVTLVARGSYPFAALLGKEIGSAYLELFKEKGVNCVMNSGLVRCIGDSGAVESVELNDGTIIPADLVIMGVGSIVNTEFLSGSGLELWEDGSVEVDELLESNVKGVFAGGDIAHAPVWSHHGKKATIGHFPLAHYHGKIAALNMLGKGRSMEAVPYFWTMLFGKGIRYAGHGEFDSTVYIGDVAKLKFVAFYIKDDEVVAASSTGIDPIVSQFAELLSQNKKLCRKDVEGNDKFTWAKKLHNL